MSVTTLTRGASWSAVPAEGEARTGEGQACADALALAIDRGLYDGSSLLAEIESAPDRAVAIRDRAERMVREADEADAYNLGAVESAAEWGSERGYKVWAPAKVPTGPTRRRRTTGPTVPVRVAFEPFTDERAELQHREGADYDVYPLHEYRVASRKRRKIEQTAGVAWRVYPAAPANIGYYQDADARKAAAKAHDKAMAEYKRARAEIDAWLADVPRAPSRPTVHPAPRKAPRKRTAPADVVIVAETVAAAPAPVPVADLPADSILMTPIIESRPGDSPVAESEPTHAVPWGTRWGLRRHYVTVPAESDALAPVVPIRADVPADPAPAAIDSPRDAGADSDPVADYLARLIHAPKRAYAEALLRGENPPDPGRPWADKVRRTLTRYGAI